MTSDRQLLVTGGHGFVAGSILVQAAGSWRVHVLSRSAAGAAPPLCAWHQADPADPVAVERLLQELRPDAIIHTAAIADIDYCQAHPDQARSVNVGFTRTLAAWCARSGARFVFCSTDTVFDGEHAPYRETDSPGPINTYAETKVAAEHVVSELLPGAAIARLALVIGLPVLGAGNSILARMMENLRQGRELRMPLKEVRTPIDVFTAGQALLELAANDLRGFVHLGGRTRLNRYEMTLLIASRLGLPTHLIFPIEDPSAPGRAPRPRDVSLDVARACAELSTRMLPFDSGLERIVEHAKLPIRP